MVEYTRGRHRLFLKKFFARGEIINGWFRQLERLVSLRNLNVTRNASTFVLLLQLLDRQKFGTLTDVGC